MKLAGRVAIVTGAGRGIGEAVALAFAREGASLVLASRTLSEIEGVAARCRQAGAESLPVVADVADQAKTEQLVQAAVERFGAVHVLVNAAGIQGAIGLLAECDLTDWERVLRINLLGTVHACRHTLPVMLAQGGGKIINLSGGGATGPMPSFTAYASSKAAVVRFTETLAQEVKEKGIDVNAIAPGMVDTSLQDEVLRAGRKAGELYERVWALRDAGAGGVSPDLAAELAVFLASSDSDGLTGKLISAPHDPWRTWAGRGPELSATPWYTLRRLDPHTVQPLLGELEW